MISKQIIFPLLMSSLIFVMGCAQKKPVENEGKMQEEAQSLKEKGEFEKAIAIYEQLIKRYPKNPDYPFYLGQLLASIKRYPEARKSFEESLKIDPNRIEAKVMLGYLDLWEEKYDQAEAIFDEVLRECPNNQGAQKGIHQVYFERSRQ